MNKVTVTLEFNSVDEARAFFAQQPTSVGSSASVSTPPLIPASMAPVAAAVQSAQIAPVNSDVPEHVRAVREAASNCAARSPSGQGAAKVKAILAQFGYVKGADVPLDKAFAVIQAFNAAA